MAYRFSWLMGLVLLAGCAAEEKQVPPDIWQKRAQMPVSESFDMTYYYTLDGQLKSLITAPHVYAMPQEEQALPGMDSASSAESDDPQPRNNEPVELKTFTIADSGVNMTFYNDVGRVESELTANRAELYEDQGFAEATGKVVVINEEGDKLETEKLYWYRDRDQIASDRFVKITTEEEIIYGDSMVANTSFTNYRIFRIRGIIKLND